MRHVSITNTTRNQLLAEQAEVADSLLSRFRGLMGRPSLPIGSGLVLEPENAIHTHFMRFPIDVVHLDREGRVLRILDSIPPFRFGPIVRRSRTVVELPAGVTRQTGTVVGDLLRIAAA